MEILENEKKIIDYNIKKNMTGTRNDCFMIGKRTRYKMLPCSFVCE